MSNVKGEWFLSTMLWQTQHDGRRLTSLYRQAGTGSSEGKPPPALRATPSGGGLYRVLWFFGEKNG